MAALQLMQQKANKDTKTEIPAITDTSEKTQQNDTEPNTTQTSGSGSEASTDSTEQAKDNGTDTPAETDKEENSLKPTTNGPVDLTTTQNGECKNPLAGKELEESIPGLAQAKELAETLVAEDGSCIGMFKKDPKTIQPGQFRESYPGGSLCINSSLLQVALNQKWIFLSWITCVSVGSF